MRTPFLALLLPVLTTALSAAPVSRDVPEDHREVYIYNGRRSSNLIALTFDDGPHQSRTPALLQTLDELDCPATFFVLGQMTQGNPRTTQALLASDHEIGNHTMSHANLRRVEADAMRSQIGDLQSHLASLGSTPRVFRPPYGSSNRGVVEYAYGELGMDVVMWSLDTEDWRTETTAQAIIDRILDETRGGEIILMHDIHSKAVPVTRAIVPALRERGFEFVNVSQMIEDMRAHPDPEPGDTAAPTSATSSD